MKLQVISKVFFCKTLDPVSVCPLFKSSVRSDIGLTSPGAVTTAKSAAPLYSFTAANPRRRSLADPLPIGQSSFQILPSYFPISMWIKHVYLSLWWM